VVPNGLEEDAMATQDIDLMDPKVFNNGIPYDYFRRLRRSERLLPATDTDGERFWYVVRHREVERIARDASVFSSSPTTMTSVRKQENPPPIITFTDAPEHTRLRKLTFKAFAPARLTALKAPIRRIVDALLADMLAKGEFDMADEVALRLPYEVLAELLGIPRADREMMYGWVRQTVNIGDPEYDGGALGDVFMEILRYCLDFAAYRAKEPADDFFSILLAARLKNSRLDLPDRLTPNEVGQFASTLVTAGIETTYCSVSGAVLALIEHGDQLARLRADRGLLPTATDEVLRWVTPVTHFARRAVTDTEVAGQPIRAGERVVLWYTSANRDEEAFTDPDRFDVARTPNPHVTFGGGGPHVCIGNGLASMEIHQFLEGVVDLLPRLELSGEPERSETNFMNSIKHLPMRVR
jgi:cholest-4-en-3-one 26-monooxygenase